MIVLAIDPGPERSGIVLYAAGRIVFSDAEMPNRAVLSHLQHGDHSPGQRLAIETMQANYAATVGASVIDTLRWVGRFQQAWHDPEAVLLLSRQRIKAIVCNGNVKANDAGVRAALIDRLGPPGTKKAPGPTYGVTSHAWAALAVAVSAAQEAPNQTPIHAKPQAA